MKHETLYKRTKTGKIQYWAIETRSSDLLERVQIRKESGQLGTKSPIVHLETVRGVNIGKSNETTPTEQAEAQALSDWKRKHDDGYKTRHDLNINISGDLMHWSFNYVNYKTLTEALEAALPQFNSDANGNVLPMLAKSDNWTPGPKNKYPMIMEDKLDGNRTTIVMTPSDTYALSRTGKPQKNLEHLIEALNTNYPPHTRTATQILDGEVYLHGLPLEEINEAIKAANENTSKLEFWVYDLPLLKDTQMTRSVVVKKFVEALNHPLFRRVTTQIAHSDAEVIAYSEQRVELKYEGIMIKDPEGTYQQGQRSSFWRKLKEWEDNEYEVISYILGQRGAQDLKFICINADGLRFEVTMNGTKASKEKIVANVQSYIGKMLTVKHKGYTKYGIPNHAKGKLFRDE